LVTRLEGINRFETAPEISGFSTLYLNFESGTGLDEPGTPQFVKLLNELDNDRGIFLTCRLNGQASEPPAASLGRPRIR
jgi:hypothetical protein